MPALRAERLCPQAVFVAPDFGRYKAVSRQVREILHRHTDLVEPLSLDEAYLDVTADKTGLPTATATAKRIREEIRAETSLTASAGVAPNKFLAKIASDWKKPDGLFVIQPHEVLDFLAPLPVGRLPGVGKATEGALEAEGIRTVADLRGFGPRELERRFGRFGFRLYELAHGIDDHPVEPSRPTLSVSSEDTFPTDLALEELGPALERAAERVWEAARREGRAARTVTLKLKTSEFRILTRRLTPTRPPSSAAELAELARGLAARVELPPTTRYRLAGVGLSGFDEATGEEPQFGLFEPPEG
jgi:DNA polymerase-4